MTTQQVGVMERGELVRPTRSNMVPTALRYLTMRTRAITVTHQRTIDEFQRNQGQHYPDVEAVVRAYMAHFKMQYAEAQARYEAQVAEINADRAMDSVRKRNEIARLRLPLTPAWTPAQERGFLNTYGEPRRDVFAWNAQLQLLSEQEVPTINGGEQVMYVRTPWEMFLPTLLQHPDMDGSVAPCELLGPQGAIPADELADIRRTREAFIPPMPAGEINQELYAKMVKVANLVCPHCLELFPNGFKQHEPACARQHEHPSIFDVETAGQTNE